MKITIESTTKLVELNGVPARLWEGQTESGIKVHAYVTRIAVDADEPRQEEFQQELHACRQPSPQIQVFDFRLIL